MLCNVFILTKLRAFKTVTLKGFLKDLLTDRLAGGGEMTIALKTFFIFYRGDPIAFIEGGGDPYQYSYGNLENLYFSIDSMDS